MAYERFVRLPRLDAAEATMNGPSPRAAALGLLERLRKVAEKWTSFPPAGINDLPAEPGDPLDRLHYYEVRGPDALKEQTP